MSESEKKQMTREEIIKKAQSDKDFKKALVDNPKETLGQLGVQLPEDVEVKVVEETAKVVYLVLPVNPDELTDEQLEEVAGGATSFGCGSNGIGYCQGIACGPAAGYQGCATLCTSFGGGGCLVH